MSSPTSCFDDFDCLNGGTCESPFDFLQDGDHVNAATPSKCICQPSFMGPKCEEPCPLLCMNGGQCLKKDDHGGIDVVYSCDCPPGYSGARCTIGGDNDGGGGSMNPVQNKGSGNSLPPGAIVGIVLGSLVVICLLMLMLTPELCRSRRSLKLSEKKTLQEDNTAEATEENVDEDVESPVREEPMDETEFVEPKTPIS